MRYHLWTVLSSRAGPYGVLDSGAVTGAARPVPYCGLSGSGGCSEAYSRSAPLPLSPSGGSLGSGGSATGPLHCNVCNIAHAVFFVKGRAGISGQIWVRPSIIIKRTETQTSRLCVFSLLQPHRTEVRLTGKYRYLTFEDRKKIEAWHLLGDRPVDIAARLSVHHTTIYKELQRGATGALDANQREGYSAELAERRLRESFKRRGKRAPAAQ